MKIPQAVCHFILYVDEASGYAVVDEIMRHPVDNNENSSTAQFLKSLHMRWIQYFGIPAVIKLALEGAFRGIQLRDWCGTRGVRLEHAPAEFHQPIGDVERQIGFLRHTIEVFLRHEPHDPSVVAAAMVGAHATAWLVFMVSVPLSGLWGKTFSLPFQPGTWGGLTLPCNIEGALSRFSETRDRKIWLPAACSGDLICYRRMKEPADRAATIVDKARMRIGRFYGPGRVLASETNVDRDGRKASHRIWIISQGRLKKCHASQLRRASEQIL